MIFDQILTKFDQILTVYVKNHKINVEKNQKCHFLKIKKTSTSTITQNPAAEQNVDTSQFGTQQSKIL